VSEVFLSYKRRADEKSADAVRICLTRLGIGVFIDHGAPAGAAFLELINEEIDSAKAVIVLWTDESRKSRWVQGEVLRAMDREILIATSFDGFDPKALPSPFNTVNTSDLSAWMSGGQPGSDREWQRVLDALGAKLGRPGLATLANVLEATGTASETARAAFIQDYPDDPMCVRFREELETIAIARAEFERQLGAEESNFERRIKETNADTRRRVEECRRDFEARLASYLASGGKLDRPDVKVLFQDRIAPLRNQVRDLTAALESAMSRAAKAEQLAQRQATDIAELSLVKQRQAAEQSVSAAAREEHLSSLQRKLQEAEDSLRTRADALAAAQRDRELLRKQASEQSALLKQRDMQVSSLLETVSQEKAASEQKSRHIGELEEQTRKSTTLVDEASEKIATLLGANQELKRRTAVRRVVSSSSLASAAVIALVAGLMAGRFIFDGNGGSRASASSGEFQALQANYARATQERDRLAGEVKKLSALPAEIEALTKVKNQQKLQLDKVAEAEAIRKCDELAAYRFDRDRPITSAWMDDHQKIDVPMATKACQEAQRLSVDPVAIRRITLQVGRISAASGHQLAEAGRLPEATDAFKNAVRLWEEAAKLGSAHAYTVLGAYYQGLFSVPKAKLDVPATKDMKRALENYEAAAALDNPVGLTSAGYAYLFPDWEGWKSAGLLRNDANDAKGREYLDRASKYDYARTQYYMGLAVRGGRAGYKEDPESGRVLIGAAYCKGDTAAKQFYDDPRNAAFSRPACR
jgi:hypothetical protein